MTSVRRGAATLLLLTNAVLASGCASTPRDFAPPVTAPSAFSSQGADVLPDQWWASLDDDGLSTLVNIGLSDNFDLKTAWDRLAQSEAIARRAGADLLPTVDLDATSILSRESFNGRTDGSDRYGVGISAGYEVDLWGRIRSGRDAALLDAMAAEEDVAAAAITLSATIADRWYELAEALALVRVLESQIETNTKTLDVLNMRFRQGQSRAEDVLRQRNLAESTRSDLILARRDVTVARQQLAVLIGLPPTATLPADAPELIDLPPLPETGVPSLVLQRRPDLRRAYRSVQSADRRVAEAIADQYPRVSLIASGDTSGEFDDLFNNWIATLAGNLFQPLFDGGRRAAEVDRTRAATSEAINEYGQALLDALREVEDALEREERQAEFVTSLGQQVETATLVIERIRDTYLNGQTDYISVLDALISKQSLERQLIRARLEGIGYRIDLCKAISGRWDLERPAPATFDAVDASPLSPDQPS